jgi:hypothetical protein
VALLLQRLGQMPHALAGPPQGRFWIPTACRFDQRLKIREQGWILDYRRLASGSWPPNPWRWFVLRQFCQTPPNCARRHAGCSDERGKATIPRGERLRRCDQSAAALVEKRRYRGKPLPDGFNLDHHHNIL